VLPVITEFPGYENLRCLLSPAASYLTRVS